jgi:hypothetical protein
MSLALSPFGMATCSVCDAPTTHAIPAEDGCLLPSCASCAKAHQEAFPSVPIYLYAPRTAAAPTSERG